MYYYGSCFVDEICYGPHWRQALFRSSSVDMTILFKIAHRYSYPVTFVHFGPRISKLHIVFESTLG